MGINYLNTLSLIDESREKFVRDHPGCTNPAVDEIIEIIRGNLNSGIYWGKNVVTLRDVVPRTRNIDEVSDLDRSIYGLKTVMLSKSELNGVLKSTIANLDSFKMTILGFMEGLFCIEGSAYALLDTMQREKDADPLERIKILFDADVMRAIERQGHPLEYRWNKNNVNYVMEPSSGELTAFDIDFGITRNWKGEIIDSYVLMVMYLCLMSMKIHNKSTRDFEYVIDKSSFFLEHSTTIGSSNGNGASVPVKKVIASICVLGAGLLWYTGLMAHLLNFLYSFNFGEDYKQTVEAIYDFLYPSWLKEKRDFDDDLGILTMTSMPDFDLSYDSLGFVECIEIVR